MRVVTEYIIGDKNRGLKHEPAQVKHGPDNPFEWTSDNQRKAFFASDGFGQGIPTKRTHETAGSWTMKETNSDWTRVNVENGAPGAEWVFGVNQQVGHKKDGWRQYWDIVETNITGAIAKGYKALDDWLATKGK